MQQFTPADEESVVEPRRWPHIDESPTMAEIRATYAKIASGAELSEEDARCYGGDMELFSILLKMEKGVPLTSDDSERYRMGAGLEELEAWGERARVRQQRGEPFADVSDCEWAWCGTSIIARREERRAARLQ